MPYLTPNTPTTNVVVRLTVPDTLLPPVVGALVSLWNPYHWEQFGTLTVPETLEIIGDIITGIYEGPNVGNCPCIVYTPIPKPNGGNIGVGYTGNGASIWGLHWYVGGNANSWISWSVNLSPGTYQLQTWFIKANNYAIVTVQVDGVQVGTIDLYSNGQVTDYYATIDNIVITTPAPHTLRFSTPTKNPASSNYLYCMHFWQFVRTG